MPVTEAAVAATAPAEKIVPTRELEIRKTPVRQFARTLRLAGRRALDFLYPPSCLVCRAATSDVGTLCPGCWTKIRFIERPYCERLGIPFAQDLGSGLLSPEAIADPPVYRRARAVACFDDGPIRTLVHLLKYGDRIEIARPLGRWMARAGVELLAAADVIVPVPLHRLRLAQRRFNQAAALAHSVSAVCGVATDFLALERVKSTPPQVGLSKLQRAGNVQGAFRVAEAAQMRISGRRIVLVDYVLTSGATTNAAARALLRGGAAQVDVLVFARVVTSL
jgi:ComF family protein